MSFKKFIKALNIESNQEAYTPKPRPDREKIVFHGGCLGCTQQSNQPNGADFCVNCKYFEFDMDLPSLSNEPPRPSDIAREEIKRRLGLNG